MGRSSNLVAAIAISLATVISKRRLAQIPLGLYSIVRTAIGTLVFFAIALFLYGSQHFTDVFAPFLWGWMLVYGIIVVVLGQSLWLKGTRNTSVSLSTLVGSFSPLAGIIAAYLILGESPTQAQSIGGSILLVSMIIHQIGTRQSERALNPIVANEVGFKGI